MLLGCAGLDAPGPPPADTGARASPSGVCAERLVVADRERLLTWTERDALASLDGLCARLTVVATGRSSRSECARAGLAQVGALRRRCWQAAAAAAKARAQGDLPTSMVASGRLLSLAEQAPRVAKSSCAGP